MWNIFKSIQPVLSANVMSLYILGQEEGGALVRGLGAGSTCAGMMQILVPWGTFKLSRTRWMIVVSWKVLFGLLTIGNWWSQRNKCANEGGSKVRQIEILRWLQQDLPSICSFSNVTLTLLPLRAGTYFLVPLNVHTQWLVEVMFPGLSHTGDRMTTCDILGY